jgi:hypothetical protein
MKKLSHFGIAELLIALAICSFLGILVVWHLTSGESHPVNATHSRIKMVQIVIDTYQKDAGRLPSEDNWEAELRERYGKSIDAQDFKDGWGVELQYRVRGESGYIVYSCGPNHRDEGGGGDDLTAGP